MGVGSWSKAVAVALGFAVAIAAALPAKAQDGIGNAAAGHAFAREICLPCHVVEAGKPAPRMLVIGPAFREIANTPGMTAMALHAFFASPHPKMPNLILTQQEAADVIAYILSLRDRR